MPEKQIYIYENRVIPDDMSRKLEQIIDNI